MRETRTIDCHYVGPRFAAAYLLLEGDEAAFVEANTAIALPHLLGALEAAGRRPEQVRWLMVTHAHLDHAGGAWALLRACPNATLLCHPRAARHLIDPSRLEASARTVYGAEAFERLYGSLQPIDPGRVQVVGDEETLRWGARTLTFLHTRGHANHHVCVHDASTGAMFTGDAFGLCFPALQGQGLYLYPSTSPTDFDPEQARLSIARIQARAHHAYPTHFGRLDAIDAAADQLLDHLDFAEALLDEAVACDAPDEALAAWCAPRVRARFEAETAARGVRPGPEGWSLMALDMDLNAQGIAWAARKRRAAPR